MSMDVLLGIPAQIKKLKSTINTTIVNKLDAIKSGVDATTKSSVWTSSKAAMLDASVSSRASEASLTEKHNELTEIIRGDITDGNYLRAYARYIQGGTQFFRIEGRGVCRSIWDDTGSLYNIVIDDSVVIANIRATAGSSFLVNTPFARSFEVQMGGSGLSGGDMNFLNLIYTKHN